MRTLLIAFLMMLATQVGAENNLKLEDWVGLWCQQKDYRNRPKNEFTELLIKKDFNSLIENYRVFDDCRFRENSFILHCENGSNDFWQISRFSGDAFYSRGGNNDVAMWFSCEIVAPKF